MTHHRSTGMCQRPYCRQVHITCCSPFLVQHLSLLLSSCQALGVGGTWQVVGRWQRVFCVLRRTQGGEAFVDGLCLLQALSASARRFQPLASRQVDQVQHPCRAPPLPSAHSILSFPARQFSAHAQRQSPFQHQFNRTYPDAPCASKFCFMPRTSARWQQLDCRHTGPAILRGSTRRSISCPDTN